MKALFIILVVILVLVLIAWFRDNYSLSSDDRPSVAMTEEEFELKN